MEPGGAAWRRLGSVGGPAGGLLEKRREWVAPALEVELKSIMIAEAIRPESCYSLSAMWG